MIRAVSGDDRRGSEGGRRGDGAVLTHGQQRAVAHLDVLKAGDQRLLLVELRVRLVLEAQHARGLRVAAVDL